MKSAHLMRQNWRKPVHLLSCALLFATSLSAQPIELKGKWSGGWTPKGGIRDAVTIELQQDSTSGEVTGRLVTPTTTEYRKASFNEKTGMLSFQVTDPKSGKAYKLDGKIEGTELIGTLVAGDVAGDLRINKWTFTPTIR